MALPIAVVNFPRWPNLFVISTISNLNFVNIGSCLILPQLFLSFMLGLSLLVSGNRWRPDSTRNGYIRRTQAMWIMLSLLWEVLQFLLQYLIIKIIKHRRILIGVALVGCVFRRVLFWVVQAINDALLRFLVLLCEKLVEVSQYFVVFVFIAGSDRGASWASSLGDLSWTVVGGVSLKLHFLRQLRPYEGAGLWWRSLPVTVQGIETGQLHIFLKRNLLVHALYLQIVIVLLLWLFNIFSEQLLLLHFFSLSSSLFLNFSLFLLHLLFF